MPNKNYFAQLSPKQKAELFKIYVKDGVLSLNEIRDHYNSFASNHFDNGGNGKRWKALNNIQYKLIPDHNFTKEKTGVGDIEVMFKDTPAEGYEYANGFKYAHPSPGNNVIIFNPETNDEQDIMLDALHIMRQDDPVYQALLDRLSYYADGSDVSFNARRRMDEDIKQYGRLIPGMGYNDYFNNEIDGLLRNMFIEGTPEYIESKQYYPNKSQLREWNKELLPYIDSIEQYLITGEKPEDVLDPSIVTEEKTMSYGGRLNNNIKLPTLAEYFSENYKTHLDNPNIHSQGGNLYGVGSWLKKIFNSNSDNNAKDSKSDNDYSGHLPNYVLEYISKFKSTDDLLNSKAYANLDDSKKNMAKRWARYYFDNDQRDVEWFKMFYGPKMRYEENRDKYERDKKYDVDMSGLNFKLKSVVNGKPTNKHTMSINYGLLDFIYNEAVRGGVAPQKAIALATNESNLGNSRMKESKINQFNLYSYWLGTGSVIYPNSKIIEPYNKLLRKFNSGEEFNSKDLEIIKDLYSKYNKMADYIHEYKGDNITADAVRDYESGKYLGTNPSKERVDAYHKLVMSRFDELMNDARFVKWWNDKQKSSKRK